MEKTHWLQSPNKNYFGHWDLPENGEITLTIESAKWEEVKNPITNTSEAKRVVRFKENVKPLICNQVNAQSINLATGVAYLEDSEGCRIQLYVDKYKDRKSKETIDVVRIRRTLRKTEQETLEQIKTLCEEKSSLISDSEKEYIDRIINNNDRLSYDKCINFLKNK